MVGIARSPVGGRTKGKPCTTVQGQGGDYGGRFDEAPGITWQSTSSWLGIRSSKACAAPPASRRSWPATVISSEGYEPPGSYADIFRVLRDEGSVDEELAERLVAMARFRNLLVHAYADVDEDRVLRILHTSLSYLYEFVRILRQRFRSELEA
jgi:hypothetical protein